MMQYIHILIRLTILCLLLNSGQNTKYIIIPDSTHKEQNVRMRTHPQMPHICEFQ